MMMYDPTVPMPIYIDYYVPKIHKKKKKKKKKKNKKKKKKKKKKKIKFQKKKKKKKKKKNNKMIENIPKPSVHQSPTGMSHMATSDSGT